MNEMMNPFVEGTLQMMGSMFGLDCQVVTVDARLAPEPTIYGSIKLLGNTEGRITISLHHTDGRQLVAAMLGLEAPEVDEEMIRDGLGEMANMIAGFARSVLSADDMHVEIGLPEIGDQPPSQTPHVIHRKFESDLGAFHLTLEMAPQGTMTPA
jgi:CheY-specific phosphatase CheX